MTILDRIVETKLAEIASIAGQAAELRERAEDAPAVREFSRALRRPGEVRLLAEIKRRSPSAGPIRPGVDEVEAARDYAAGGAAALSVLTDASYFGGGLEVLRRVRSAVDLPVLRKDFILDPLQVWESRAAGADAILLIVRILSAAQIRDLHSLASELRMTALVEVHGPEELDQALTAGVGLIGVNHRDLDTFSIDLSLTAALAPRVPSDVTLVAESGIRVADDVRRLGAVGVDAVLVGESLMRQEDLRAATAALVGHSKASRESR